jgi:hypothetical protein
LTDIHIAGVELEDALQADQIGAQAGDLHPQVTLVIGGRHTAVVGVLDAHDLEASDSPTEPQVAVDHVGGAVAADRLPPVPTKTVAPFSVSDTALAFVKLTPLLGAARADLAQIQDECTRRHQHATERVQGDRAVGMQVECAVDSQAEASVMPLVVRLSQSSLAGTVPTLLSVSVALLTFTFTPRRGTPGCSPGRSGLAVSPLICTPR